MALAEIGRALRDCAERQASGVLAVTGEPGGSVHLADGGIVAVRTPGAPEPGVVLLRSGRLSEDDWDAALTTAASGAAMAGELAARGLISGPRLEALIRLAIADALFVIAAGRIDSCVLEDGPLPWPLPLVPPLPCAAAMAETERRLRAIATLARPIDPGRDRLSASPDRPRPGPLGDGQDQIMAAINGRRTVRDLAFVLGRGVYSLLLEVTRLRDNGLLVISSRRPAAPDPGPAPALDPAPAPDPDPGPAPDPGLRPGPEPGPAAPARSGILPRRRQRLPQGAAVRATATTPDHSATEGHR